MNHTNFAKRLGQVAHILETTFLGKSEAIRLMLIAAVARMPRTTGIALGVDRLVAALMSWDGIGPGRVE